VFESRSVVSGWNIRMLVKSEMCFGWRDARCNSVSLPLLGRIYTWSVLCVVLVMCGLLGSRWLRSTWATASDSVILVGLVGNDLVNFDG
jgi:hypothetical protein